MGFDATMFEVDWYSEYKLHLSKCRI